jgi:hypothetical protein
VSARITNYVLFTLGGIATLTGLAITIAVWLWHRSNLEHVRAFVEQQSGCPATRVRITYANPLEDEYRVDVCGRRGIVHGLFPDPGWVLVDETRHFWSR